MEAAKVIACALFWILALVLVGLFVQAVRYWKPVVAGCVVGPIYGVFVWWLFNGGIK